MLLVLTDSGQFENAIVPMGCSIEISKVDLNDGSSKQGLYLRI